MDGFLRSEADFSRFYASTSTAFWSSSRGRRLSRRLAGGVPAATDAELERIEGLASLREVRSLLREQLQTLEPGQREALWLRVVEKQPYAAVGKRLGISEQAARTRVSRALRVLSEPLAAAQLGKEGAGRWPSTWM